MDNKFVVRVAAGEGCTVAVTSDGGVWMCRGRQRGFVEVWKKRHPSLWAVGVACGREGLLFVLTRTNCVYELCTARGDTRRLLEDDVVGIAASPCWDFRYGDNVHLAAWSSDGKVWTWGRGCYGQLGHGDYEDQAVPRRVDELEKKGVVVVGVALGHHHTVAWTNEGELFTWGSDRDHQLGKGGHKCTFVEVPFYDEQYAQLDDQDRSILCCATPCQVTSLKGRRVVGAAAADHTMVLGQGGVVFVFGSDEKGQLGQGQPVWPLQQCHELLFKY